MGSYDRVWVVTDRYEQRRRSTNLWSILWVVGGLLLILFGGFWCFIGAVALWAADTVANWNGALFLVLGGLLPGVAGAVCLFIGITGLVRVARWRLLAGLVRANPGLAAPDIARAMGISTKRAEVLLAGAVRQGVILGDPSGSSHPAAWAQPFTVPVASPAPLAAAAQVSSVPRTVVESGVASVPNAARQGSPLVGRILKGTWQIESQLGAGAMGAVFRARHMRTGRCYALKAMLGGEALSADALRRFEREATAASALGHPNIVAVHDFDRTEEGLPFLVMDLLEGETLARRLDRQGSLPWQEAQKIALEVGGGLARAHEHGLLHRDVKPANIFLAGAASTGGQRAVLVDFGLVKPVDPAASRITATGVPVGTPLYMSPEQARGEAIDVRSDLYGLAAVVYEMVTGAPPFFDRTLAEVYARLLKEPAPLASSVAPDACPPGLDDVLARALAKSPTDRFADVRAFMEAIARLQAARPRTTLAMA
ncbi:MAG: serine/threonine protein kinase [Deltaproteobacteria bacterium]|nr:serine/threonine protein kinase [Deltaproteobacteria bacterium]